MSKNLTIKIHNWTSACADGCCYDWGTTVKVNGEEVSDKSDDLGLVLEKVLIHLGYEVEIYETYD